MKKNFCKVVAIILASSMMSMTVFAAEDTFGSEPGTGAETSQPAQDSTGSDSTGSDTGSSTGDNTNTNTDENKGSQPAEEHTTPANTDNGENKDAEDTENSGENKSSETGDTQETTPASTPAPTPSNDTSESSGSDNSSDNGEQRRTAAIESQNWSNGDLEDVMGVKAVSDGQTVTISYKTKNSNEWEHTWQNYPLTITYPDGTTQTIIIDYNMGVHGNNWSDVPGYSVTQSSDQADTLTLNISIPASYFASTDFTVSSQKYSTSVNGDVIEDVSTSDPNAVYQGIGLDGNFNDWNAVTKYDLKEPNGEHNVESVAWVIDSDRGYVYIYVKDDGNNSATWAGPNHNGKFEILTDLGNRMLIQLTHDGAVVGANGYDAVHTGSQWEIAIPISELPANTGGLSFGLYMEESSLSGYGDTGEIGSKVGITYDGNSDDWKYYPSTLIQYATPGTQEMKVDGEAKQYCDQEENIYGYCTTQMDAHLSERGGEFTQAVRIAVNNDWDWNKTLEMRLVTVDSNGNINWNPQRQGLPDGSYEYYIFATNAWGSSKNINELVPADVCYGKTTINISGTEQEMEWYVNTVKLAERYGIDATDVKVVSTKYLRIGNQEVTCAGTSSGPWGGAAMCMLSAFVPFVIRKKFVF
ncbi:hypothetical protein D6855_03035 [Butyrivibrio sp. CB08]|uniref:Firmicu-CTERM sorting domain-containing protein n=1 Tax=Butyrivibrio sp. CB08 TaxID=2364879 RepID=UPI000EAA25A9|nr:Firmicu-CTERM sorting domain-containing protein [Butyrivibrio sp. CB08]RKM62405.1 hypothetical protein D6855_03035 [Butyrivibrio sp. CB08]